MEEKLKYRLTGAAVVVTLGVIFLPMILDGGPRNEPQRTRIEIPPHPGSDRRRAQTQTRARPAPPAAATARPAKPKPPAAQATKKPAPKKPVAGPEPAAKKPAAPKPEPAAATKPEPATAAKPKPAPAKRPQAATNSAPQTPPAAPPIAWVVQVGSFNSRQNAEGLRDELRKAGFTSSFVESFVAAGKTAHRVRIGPTARPGAESDLERLREKMKLDGIIVRYP